MFPLFPLKVENIKVDVYEERQKSPLAIIFYSVSQNKWESGNTGNGAAFLPRKDKVMNEKITELLRLIKENPDLPILPMVDGEICAGDDYGYWSGSWGTARVDEFLKPNTVVFAETRFVEELRQNVLGADNDRDIQYWRAYLDGAKAQAEEDGYTEEALQ